MISQTSNIPIFFPSVLSPLHWSCTAYVYCYVWQIYMFLDILYTRMLPSRHSISSVSAQHIYTSMYHTHTLSLTHTHTRTHAHTHTYKHIHMHTHIRTHTHAHLIVPNFPVVLVAHAKSLFQIIECCLVFAEQEQRSPHLHMKYHSLSTYKNYVLI